ncbi:T9SS type A sorting domain-containing protein [Pontibacter ruber]|uniref:T9SS type A sorting domain-containing protein n=1 Tax=Pontibacter ruber TaxID=1343895 RepID=A0ABW5CWL9_9BACT|nr:T9SS type A sorting domain-containing protein [Pontibacter ruber]
MKTFYFNSVARGRKFLFFTCLWSPFILLVSFTLQAQVPVKEWDRTFGGTGYDVLRSVQQTKDGGYILGGLSYSNRSVDKSEDNKTVCDSDDPDECFSDYWVVKTDATGNKQWEQTIGGNKDDQLMSVQQTQDGGYILGGFSDSDISEDKSEASRGSTDYWIVKLDHSGNIEWDKTIGGQEGDALSALQQTDDGGYIMGGTSLSGIGGDKTDIHFGYGDYWVVKTDASGKIEWNKTFGGDDIEHFSSLQQTEDGGYIVGGSSSSFTFISDYWILKLDAQGEQQWNRAYGGNSTDQLQSLQQTDDMGYILGGFSSSGISGDKTEMNLGFDDYWVIKVDASGNIKWDKTIGGEGHDWLYSLYHTSDGGYILGGGSESGISKYKTEASKGSFDYWIVKLNKDGGREWDKTLGGERSDVLYSLMQTNDEGYILGGHSSSGISGDKSEARRGRDDWDDPDYWVIKLSPESCTPPTPYITVIPTSDVYTGGDPSTIYLGYGAQSVQLVASGAESYEWSPSTGLSSTTVADPVFTPTAAGTYTITVTAYNGACSATASVTITVVDIHCGKGKVQVCHKGKQLCISTSAVAAHLRNHKQDRLGNCSNSMVAEDNVTVTIPLRVKPNPIRDWADVEFSLPLEGDYRLELYNSNGKMLGVVAQGQGQEGQLVQLELKGEQLREGVYYLRLTTPDKVQTVRLILEK